MRHYARQQTALLLDRLAAALNRAARAGDAASIHDVRVAMRRLSRCLRVFARFYPDGSWKKVRRRISGLMALAGAVRDCDIAIELARRAAPSRPRAGDAARSAARDRAMVAQLAALRRKTGRDLLLEIRRWKSRDFPRQWRSRLELQAVNTTSQIAGNLRMSAMRNARRQLPPLVQAYFARVRELLAASPPPAELHTVRLATKRLRYTLELFRPVYGQGLEIRLAALQRLQQVLGEINDCAAAERLIEAIIPTSAERRRVQSFLRRRASAKAVALRKEWHDTFDAPGRERWWTQYLARSPRAPKPSPQKPNPRKPSL